MKLVIDSNVFVGALDPNDIFHSECYPLFEKLLDLAIEAVCPVLILVETTCAIRRRTNSELIARRAYRKLSVMPAINWLDITLPVAKLFLALVLP